MILDLSADDVAPDRAPVLAQLGIPPDRELPPHIEDLYRTAADRLAAHVAPTGVLADVSADEFAGIYEGDGRNAPAGPVADLFPRADHLALFAVTLGEAVGTELRRCFDDRDFALAYALDAMASVAADQLAEVAERRYADLLRARGWAATDGVALRYSPGYCGWDVSGQRRLFARLQPSRIGLTLTASCLMQPMKSVSGVLMAGPRTMHRFRPSYDFCEACEDRTCRKRLAEIFRR